MDQGWLSFLAFILCEMGATIEVWTQNETCSNRFLLAVSWKQITGEVWIEAGGKLVERDHVGSNSGGAGEECSVRFRLPLFWSESNRISRRTAWREKRERRKAPRLQPKKLEENLHHHLRWEGPWLQKGFWGKRMNLLWPYWFWKVNAQWACHAGSWSGSTGMWKRSVAGVCLKSF